MSVSRFLSNPCVGRSGMSWGAKQHCRITVQNTTRSSSSTSHRLLTHGHALTRPSLHVRNGSVSRSSTPSLVPSSSSASSSSAPRSFGSTGLSREGLRCGVYQRHATLHGGTSTMSRSLASRLPGVILPRRALSWSVVTKSSSSTAPSATDGGLSPAEQKHLDVLNALIDTHDLRKRTYVEDGVKRVTESRDPPNREQVKIAMRQMPRFATSRRRNKIFFAPDHTLPPQCDHIVSLAKNRNRWNLLKLDASFAYLRQERIKDNTLLACLICSYTRFRQRLTVSKLLEEADKIQNEQEWGSHLYHAAIYASIEWNEMEQAKQLLIRQREAGLMIHTRTFNLFVSAFSLNRADEAEALVRELQWNQTDPIGFYSFMFRLFGKAGRPNDCRRLFDEGCLLFEDQEGKLNTFIGRYTSIVASFGDIDEALRVAEMIPMTDFTYSTIDLLRGMTEHKCTTFATTDDMVARAYEMYENIESSNDSKFYQAKGSRAMVEFLFAHRRPEEAAQIFETSLRDNDDSLTLYAMVAGNASDPKTARRYYDMTLDQENPFPLTGMAMMHVYALNDDWKGVTEIFGEMLVTPKLEQYTTTTVRSWLAVYLIHGRIYRALHALDSLTQSKERMIIPTKIIHDFYRSAVILGDDDMTSNLLSRLRLLRISVPTELHHIRLMKLVEEERAVDAKELLQATYTEGHRPLHPTYVPVVRALAGHGDRDGCHELLSNLRATHDELFSEESGDMNPGIKGRVATSLRSGLDVPFDIDTFEKEIAATLRKSQPLAHQQRHHDMSSLETATESSASSTSSSDNADGGIEEEPQEEQLDVAEFLTEGMKIPKGDDDDTTTERRFSKETIDEVAPRLFRLVRQSLYRLG